MAKGDPAVRRRAFVLEEKAFLRDLEFYIL